MPYIPQENRDKIDARYFRPPKMFTPGELNYTITRLLLSQGPRRYADYNALIGVLECCKLELYRRAVAVYEDRKAAESGDIPGYGGQA